MDNGITSNAAAAKSADGVPGNGASIPDGPNQVRFTTQGQTPHEILSTYNEDEWEIFVEESMYGVQPPYASVQRFSGSGDKGRDIACFATEPVHSSHWDNFQCKHYPHPLHPGDIWVELGKLCHYTFKGDYTVPRRYRFAALNEVGPTIKDLFLNPEKLRAGLIANWSKDCEKQITETGSILLDGAFRDYVNNFDFAIVGYVPIAVLIQQHSKTSHWFTRFRLCPPLRPDSMLPPPEPAAFEATYVRKLLDAYADSEKCVFAAPDDISASPHLAEHFKRARRWFFKAESLNRFSRESYPPRTFEKVKEQVHDGIAEVVSGKHGNGLERVDATTACAGQLKVGNSPLAEQVESGDLKGMCHHLANDGKIEWVLK
jgi:hypothetical protein